MKKLQIPLISLKERGVHTEMFNEAKDSFFKDTYEQAFRAVLSIHQANMKRRDKRSWRQQVHDIQNVIAFSGRRGTGKTSAMLTFANALHDDKLEELLSGTKALERCKPETEDGIPGIKKCEFYALPYVDASLLAETEDLFIVVLSKMLYTLDEFERNMKDDPVSEYRNSCLGKLRKDINDVYNQYVGLKGKEKYSEAYSYQAMVKNAQKHNLREAFKKLIESYIEVCFHTKIQDNLCPYHESRRNDPRYLVICIDDIDMAQNGVMEIMSCIYTYFMLPNVIVLTTLNFTLLSKAIEKYYYNTLVYGNKSEDYFSTLCKEQTNDYLRKIISSDMRIVMPSWKKSDYREFIEMKVDLSDGTKDAVKVIEEIEESLPNLKDGHLISYLRKIMNNKKKEVAISPKELMLLMLADRTGIYLDAVGFKRHFMEPDSLRNMVDLFNLFYSMENPRVKTGDEKAVFKYTPQHTKIFQQNIKIIMDYFYFKLVPDFCLSYEEEMIFHQFYTAVLSRRAKRIITYYRKKLEQRHKENVLIQDQLEAEGEFTPIYNYGEMFRVIHHASRLEIVSKEMIKAILACYSFILPRIFDEYVVDYLDGLDQQLTGIEMSREEFESLAVRQKIKILYSNNFHDNLKKPRLLYELFGNTLLGNWNLDLFCGKRLGIRTREIKKEIMEASLYLPDNYKSFFDIEDKKDNHLGYLLTNSVNCIEKIGKIRDEEKRKYIAEKVKEYTGEYEDIHATEISAKIYTAVSLYENEYPLVHLIYLLMLYPLDYRDKPSTLYSSKLDLDPTAFVVNVSRYREFFDWLMEVQFATTALKKMKSKFKVHCQYVKDRIEFYIHSQRYPHFVLPLHQTDLIYNVIKRSVGEIVYSSDFLLEKKKRNNKDISPEKTIQMFYKNIRKELRREDEVYTNANRSITYEEQFVSCPVVQHFLYWDEKKHDNPFNIKPCNAADGSRFETSQNPESSENEGESRADFEKENAI